MIQGYLSKFNYQCQGQSTGVKVIMSQKMSWIKNSLWIK